MSQSCSFCQASAAEDPVDLYNKSDVALYCAKKGLDVRSNTIHPTFIDTPILDRLPQTVKDSLAAAIPHPARLGRPHEFAMMAAAILENPMLNGETIRLDGAIRMAPR